MEMTEQYWTVPEAAAFLGVSKSAIYEAVREERMASEMVFGRRVVKREAVLAYQQKTVGVGPKGGDRARRSGGVRACILCRLPMCRSVRSAGRARQY